MARKTKHPEHANHERWLVSYADFITLLFAFFVVMFATSHADKDKQKVVSAAVKEAINEGTFVTVIAGFLGKSKDNQNVHLREAKPYAGSPNEPKNPKKEKQEQKTSAAKAAVVELMPTLQTLASDLQKEIESGKLYVSLEPRGLVVSLKEAAFFPAASDAINRDAYPTISKVADTIRKLNNPVRLEGHTDAIPIKSARFPSNWALSSARSIAMLELLETKFGIDRAHMAVAGYADTVPIADNASPEGRAKNRRVDIVVLNQFGLASEPKAQAPPKKPAADEDEYEDEEPPAKAPPAKVLPSKASGTKAAKAAPQPVRKPSAAGPPVKPQKGQ